MTDYTRYDFEQLLERLSELVKEKEGFGDAYKSSTAQTFLEAVADVTDNLHYMLERRSRENFLPTAKLDSSVKSIVSSIGYRPRRIVSAKGTLELTILDEDGNPTEPEGIIYIPKHTKVKFDDYEFVTLEDIEIDSSTSSATFEIAEGRMKTITSDPDDENELSEYGFVLVRDYEYIDNDIIEVYTEDKEYADIRGDDLEIQTMALASPDDPAYDIRIANDGLRFYFGDGTFGKAPSSKVTIEYLETSGPDLNIQREGLSFEFESDTLEDDVNVTPPNEYEYRLENITPISGGLDGETVNDMRRFAPEFVRSGNRAVTNYDFRFWALQSGIGGIVDAYSYGEEELGITVFNMNNVYLTYLKEDGSELTVAEKTRLKEFFDQLKVITTQMIFEPAEIVPLQLRVRFRRSDQLETSNSELYSIVKDEIEKWFKFEEESIGSSFYLSELTKHFQNLTITRDGIDYDVARWVTLEAYGIYTVEDHDGSEFDIQIPVPLLVNEDDEIQIKKGSIELLDESHEKIGYDDPEGTEKAETEFEGDFIIDDEVKGIVNYKDGTIKTDDDVSSGDYYIRYLQNEDQNFDANVRTAIGYKPFPESLEEDEESGDEFFSRIEIVGVNVSQGLQ